MLSVSAAQRWRAPDQDGGVLVDPPFAEVPRLLEENRQRLAADCLILGRPLREWRREATPESTIACGHQPELFHPGVWIKNFALNGIARHHGLRPVNLIINTDTIKSTSLRLPVCDRDPAKVRIVDLPFDQWIGEVPYESRNVIDKSIFLSLPQRAREIYNNWGITPLLPQFWDEVTKTMSGRPSNGAQLAHPVDIGHCFSSARGFVERNWGCCNLEIPLSRMLYDESAKAFFVHLLDDLPRFHSIYNDCVRAYRRQHGLHSKTHPVPDLAADGDLLEAPFWLHHARQRSRHRFFVRRNGNQIHLCFDLKGSQITFFGGFAELLDSLPGTTECIQTRALTTTMFARLFLCDLFIHGIGGGIYDELTDTIIRRYFGIEPPTYMVISGTLRLPLPTFPATPATRRQLQREFRDLHWNPQRYVDAGELAERRERWRASQPADSTGRRERFRGIQALTTLLRDLVPAEEIARREQQLQQCERELAANAILQRRDYAFCLYPEELLRPFCTRFLNLE